MYYTLKAIVISI